MCVSCSAGEVGGLIKFDTNRIEVRYQCGLNPVHLLTCLRLWVVFSPWLGTDVHEGG